MITLISSCLTAEETNTTRLPSDKVPGGLNPAEVPQFICFGFDDNGYGGIEKRDGLTWVTDIFAERKNSIGSKNRKTYDGQPLHYTFFVTTKYILEYEVMTPLQNKIAWHTAYKNGNEIAIHTHTHPQGGKFTIAQWEKEIQTCLDYITRPFDKNEIETGINISKGIGVPKSDVAGFRASFLEYNNNSFKVLQKMQLKYDSSIEEGFQNNQDGTNYLWPYTLDQGSPGNEIMTKYIDVEIIGSYPGLWEMPIYNVIVPPDDKCRQYGIAPGLRKKLHTRVNYFSIKTGKITGLDWNLWFEFEMTKEEFTAVLKYTLDLRLQGNRCPLIFGAHSDYYADDFFEDAPNATPEERRQAVKEFIDYALTKPEVRITNIRELIDWLENPVSL